MMEEEEEEEEALTWIPPAPRHSQVGHVTGGPEQSGRLHPPTRSTPLCPPPTSSEQQPPAPGSSLLDVSAGYRGAGGAERLPLARPGALLGRKEPRAQRAAGHR